MDKTDETLKSTIERAKAGNQIAFSSLLDAFWNDLYGFQLIITEEDVARINVLSSFGSPLTVPMTSNSSPMFMPASGFSIQIPE